MNCPNCGANLPFGTEVCPICNIALVEKKKKSSINFNHGKKFDRRTIQLLLKILLIILIIALGVGIILYFTVFHTLKNATSITFSGEKIETIYGLTEKAATSAIKSSTDSSETVVFRYQTDEIEGSDIQSLKSYLDNEDYKVASIGGDNYLFAKASTTDGLILIVKMEKTDSNYVFTYIKSTGNLSNYDLVEISDDNIMTKVSYSLTSSNHSVTVNLPYDFYETVTSETQKEYSSSDFSIAFELINESKETYLESLSNTYTSMSNSTDFTNLTISEELNTTINGETWYYKTMKYTFSESSFTKYFFYKELDQNNIIEAKVYVIDKEIAETNIISSIDVEVTR